MKKIMYREGASRLVLPDGAGEVERGVPREVPDELADALVARGDFELVDDGPPFAGRE